VTGLVLGGDDLTGDDRDVLQRLLGGAGSAGGGSTGQAKPDKWTTVTEYADGGEGPGAESALVLDHRERLLVLGVGTGAREVPFKDIIHARLAGGRGRRGGGGGGGGDDDADCRVAIELRGLGTPEFALASPSAAQDLLEALDAVIDMCADFSYPLVNFGVLKRSSGGVHQPRVLQLDIPNRLVSNIHKGELRTEFHFSQVSGVKRDGQTGVTLMLRDFEPYEYVAQTPEEQQVLLRVLHEVSTQDFPVHRLTHADLALLPLWPREFRRAGVVEREKGGGHFSRRWVALAGAALLVFRDDRAATPAETVALLGARVGQEGTHLFAVTAEHSEHVFRAGSAGERDAWVAALEAAQQDARKDFADFQREFKERERMRRLKGDD
jgi:hypothetical protein